MNQTQVYVLDLTKLLGSGDFRVQSAEPDSPDDCTEEAYSILEGKVSNLVWRN